MKIIEQSHEILHMDGLDRIEMAGRTCYKSEDKIGCALQPGEPDCLTGIGGMVTAGGRKDCSVADCQHHSASRFAQMLIKRGHEAMIEHGSATVKFITNRGVTHELVRHRVASFGQESTRYVNYGGDDIAFIRPVWFDADNFDQMGREHGMDFLDDLHDRFAAGEGCPLPVEKWVRSMLFAEKDYKEALKDGLRPEQAREVLPNSLKTEIVITANYREWRHIFKLRAIGTAGKPHPQMQALMLPVLAEFKQKLPALFGDLGA